MAALVLLRNTARCSPMLRLGVVRPSCMLMRSVPMATSSGVDTKDDFFSRNERLKRPMSPHVLIWKWELPPIMSVFHRSTGVAMTAVTTTFALCALGLPDNLEHYVNIVKSFDLPRPLIFSAKTVLAWPICYHAMNGVRHLFWDMGKGFDMDVLYKTGWTVILGATVAAGALAWYM